MMPSTGVPPVEEKLAMVGGSTPYSGVLLYSTAPTAIAPSAFAWPTMVEEPVSPYSLNTMFQSGRGPELYPVTAGITLVGW